MGDALVDDRPGWHLIKFLGKEGSDQAPKEHEREEDARDESVREGLNVCLWDV